MCSWTYIYRSMVCLIIAHTPCIGLQHPCSNTALTVMPYVCEDYRQIDNLSLELKWQQVCKHTGNSDYVRQRFSCNQSQCLRQHKTQIVQTGGSHFLLGADEPYVYVRASTLCFRRRAFNLFANFTEVGDSERKRRFPWTDARR